MNTTSAPADSAPETLRASMVDCIKDAGHARTSRVEDALRTVARHEFVRTPQWKTPTPTSP